MGPPKPRLERLGIPEGFREIEPRPGEPWLAHFAINDGNRVKCLWCARSEFQYSATRMREHVVAPPGYRPPCAGIPAEIASDLSKQRVMDTRMAADVIRTHLRMRLTEGETMDQIQDWYHRPSTSQLLQGLAGAPRNTSYEKPAYAEVRPPPPAESSHTGGNAPGVS